jgi:hypothetical protein
MPSLLIGRLSNSCEPLTLRSAHRYRSQLQWPSFQQSILCKPLASCDQLPSLRGAIDCSHCDRHFVKDHWYTVRNSINSSWFTSYDVYLRPTWKLRHSSCEENSSEHRSFSFEHHSHHLFPSAALFVFDSSTFVWGEVLELVNLSRSACFGNERTECQRLNGAKGHTAFQQNELVQDQSEHSCTLIDWQ